MLFFTLKETITQFFDNTINKYVFMNTLLENIYNTGYVEDAEGNLINPFPTATASEIGLLFYELIQKLNLQRTIEIGMAYGLSTVAICQAHRDQGIGSHIAIDPFQNKEWKSIGLLNVKKAGLEDKLRFLEEFSHKALPQLLAAGEQFDFAFIDGSHLFEDVLVDFFYIDKMLRPESFIVFDDIWMPSVRKVVNFVLKNKSYQLVNISTKPNLLKRIKRITRRIAQNPFELDFTDVKYIPENICILKKIGEDNRAWDVHRSF